MTRTVALKISLASLCVAWPLTSCEAQSLSSRIHSAAPGQTITIEALHQDEELDIQNLHFTSPITIQGGSFRRISIRNSSGIVFSKTHVRPVFGVLEPAINILNARNISLRGISVEGSGVEYALRLRTVENVVVSDATLFKLRNGIRGVDVAKIEIVRSLFNTVTHDDIALGGARDVTIADNIIGSDIFEPGSHPDAIQLWDMPGIASANISIVRNRINSNKQGIFVKSEGRGGFDFVRIENNDVVASFPNGISLTVARNSRLIGNSLRYKQGSRWGSTMKLYDSSDILVEANRACAIRERANVRVSRRGNIEGVGCLQKPK